MKIKTLEFSISNYAGNETYHSKSPTSSFILSDAIEHYPISNPEDVDSAVNKFIKGKDIVDIKVDYYTIQRHNNGGYDSIIARYTIIYK